jgi:hypothetical protein
MRGDLRKRSLTNRRAARRPLISRKKTLAVNQSGQCVLSFYNMIIGNLLCEGIQGLASSFFCTARASGSFGCDDGCNVLSIGCCSVVGAVADEVDATVFS